MQQTFVVNTVEKDFILYPDGQEKFVKVFKYNKPLPVSPHTAARLITSYNRFKTVLISELKKYYPKGFTTAVVRDAGIGDLLLLEPVIGWLGKTRKSIELATIFPEVLEHHPNIQKAFKQERKYDEKMFQKRDEVVEVVRLEDWSERHPQLHKITRTDIYFNYFGKADKIKAADKEPRLYFNYSPYLKKEKGIKYIGVSLDATQKERSFPWENLPQKAGIKYVLISSKTPDTKLHRANVIDLRGETSIEEMFSLVADLDGLIATDSGIMHVGLTLHIPTYCIFSIIKPRLRLQYYTGSYEAIETKYTNKLDIKPALEFISKNQKFKTRLYSGKKNSSKKSA